MAVFEPGKPVVTKEPRVVVENKLRAGEYLLTLVVVVDGVESKPVERRLIVSDEVLRPFTAEAPKVSGLKPRGATTKKSPADDSAPKKPKKPRTKK